MDLICLQADNRDYPNQPLLRIFIHDLEVVKVFSGQNIISFLIDTKLNLTSVMNFAKIPVGANFNVFIEILMMLAY